MAKEILINQLFAGKYLKEGENIGHEVINLFKDDDGHNNLFITPSGYVKDHNVEHILFVRLVTRRTVEVVGLAKNPHFISKEEMDQIKYAGVSLIEIFKNNTFHGEAEVDPSINHVTFRAEYFILPAKRLFITIDNNYHSDEQTIVLDSGREVIIPQKMRAYFSDEADAREYTQLKSIIDDNSYWEKDNTTNKVFRDGSVYNQSPSFLEVIQKEDDENIFSNLLAYFFEYNHQSFQKFAAEETLLNIPDINVSFTVLRENNRIDLWIESEKDIIVIENKIKSGINGITSSDYSQLNTYHEKAEKEANKLKKKTHYYIFAPDYASFDLSKYGMENVYTVIKYSKIYEFFIKEAATYIADRAFPDFVRGLRRHTLTLPELRFETMRTRLFRKINQQ